MKTALVKQVLDVFGPWADIKWKDTSPQKLFEIWPGKAVYWELTCILRADWYIIPQAVHGEYTKVAVDKFPGRADTIIKYTRNVTPVESIPFDQYDLVISFDAILRVPPDHPTLFAYYAQEHWDSLYSASLRRPVGEYDLFLAHMIDSEFCVNSLPQAISFPYLHDLRLTRSTFSRPREERVWVDWRTLTTLALMDPGEPWREEADAAARRLAKTLSVPLRYRGQPHTQTYTIADPPLWGDLATYFQEMAECKYYVGVGRITGAGQGLGDAASVGCLCVGQSDRPYHKLICHPLCICEDIAQMPIKLKNLAGSKDLQQEVLSYQDDALAKHFEHGPLDLLKKALELKSAHHKNGKG